MIGRHALSLGWACPSENDVSFEISGTLQLDFSRARCRQCVVHYARQERQPYTVSNYQTLSKQAIPSASSRELPPSRQKRLSIGPRKPSRESI